MINRLQTFSILAVFAVCLSVQAQQTESEPAPARPAMDNARLGALILRLDPKAQGRPGYWQLKVREHQVVVITDEDADRMRILTGVSKTDGIPPELLYRLMQANFDTALDARYAIAQDVVWSAFIHPLRSLGDEQFVSGLAQVVTLASTFGSTFSSGGVTFGGGDSGTLLQELEDRMNAI